MNFEQGRKIYNFCEDWRFVKGEQKFAQYNDYDDSGWRSLSVPHDWSIEGPFSRDAESTSRGGYLPCGIGWYRKSFSTPENSLNRKIEVEFDGIFRHATIYINGIQVGYRPCGYVPQVYDISKFLYRDGRDNLIAVRVDNSDQPGHRYYSGCGIYREVRLIVRDELHISNFAPFITTEVKDDIAKISIETTIKNDTKEQKIFKLSYELYDANNIVIAKSQSKNEVVFGGNETILQDALVISNPNLWDIDSPYLYTLKTTVYGEDGVCDVSSERVGVRTIEYTADHGFFLNGRKVFMKGVCLHHDNGCLGSVSNRRAEQRKLEIMREMGCNAIRLSHNPFSRSFLDLCDEMGFLVMDEAFDEWRLPKVIPSLNPDDPRYKMLVHNYYMDFDKWHKADLEAMLIRDRNHPSIVMWSIGNEIPEQRQNAFEGNETAMKLAKIVKDIDTTRPITCACCFGQPGCIDSAFTDALDVIGYNYGSPRYEVHPQKFPGRLFIGTETTSHPWFKKRGAYDPEIFSGKKAREIQNDEVLDNDDTLRITSAERDMMRHKACEGVCGMFIWTGVDYLGEPTPHLWPSRSSYFAPVDTCGFKKDSFYYYQSQWSDKPVLHIVAHWNWQGMEGKNIDILTFTNCDKVELFLNGKSLGEKEYDHYACSHLMWVVPYVAGELKAVGYIDGKVVAEDILRTTDEAYSVRLSVDREEISSDGNDIAFVSAEIIDKNGRVVPNAENLVTFTVSDDISILGIDNGDPEYVGSLKSNAIPALAGKCLIVIGGQGVSGQFSIKASSKGIKSSTVTISVK